MSFCWISGCLFRVLVFSTRYVFFRLCYVLYFNLCDVLFLACVTCGFYAYNPGKPGAGASWPLRERAEIPKTASNMRAERVV